MDAPDTPPRVGAGTPLLSAPPTSVSAHDPVAAHTAGWLLAWARHALAAGTPGQSPGPPPAGARAPRPTRVFLTAFVAERVVGVSGAGESLHAAVSEAVRAARPLLAGGPAPRRLQLDVLRDAPTPLPTPGRSDAPANEAERAAWWRLTSWQDGLLVTRAGRAWWLVPGQLLLMGMGRRRRERTPPTPRELARLALERLGLAPEAWRDPNVGLWSFQIDAWVEDATLHRALPLVQGIVPAGHPDRAALLASAAAGGEYLLRAQAADGSFSYALDPWCGTSTSGVVNVVRHAGTAWALFDLAEVTDDRRLLDAAARAVRYLTSWCRPGAEPDLEYIVDTNGKAKLGALGLGLLALSRKLALAPEPGDRERAVRLARQIVALQQPDGAFQSYLRLPGDEPDGKRSLYYPGEAILGLTALARVLGEAWPLEAAHRGATSLIESRRGAAALPPDAWLVQALEALIPLAPGPAQRIAYREHALALALAMLADQYRESAPPGFVGAFAPEPIRSARASSRAEGLLAAYRLAAAASDGRAGEIRAGLRRLAPLLLALQYDADNSFFLPEPTVARGGVRGGLDDAEIRIDYVQHHISTMLGLAR